jgi:ComF family protein
VRDGRPTLRAVADAIITLALAPSCAACDAALEHPLAGPVCDACWDSVDRWRPPLCRFCGDALPSWRIISLAEHRCAACRRRSGAAIDAARSIGAYTGVLERIVRAHKYDGRRSVTRRLGPLLRRAGESLVEGASCAVPVPLHPWRRIQRGFNQASDLAATLPLPVVHALQRVRATDAQTGLGATARRRNVDGAFRLSCLLRTAVRRYCLTDRAVVLVDDVRTTGATLDACARVLKAAGVREVRALTVARALAPVRPARREDPRHAVPVPLRQPCSATLRDPPPSAVKEGGDGAEHLG